MTDENDTATGEQTGEDLSLEGVEAALTEQLDALESRAFSMNPAKMDMDEVSDFGEDVHEVAVGIDANLYLTRQLRDREVDADHDHSDEELAEHIDRLAALRERLTTLVVTAPAKVSVETTPGQTKTTAGTKNSPLTFTREAAYGAESDPLPVAAAYAPDVIDRPLGDFRWP